MSTSNVRLAPPGSRNVRLAPGRKLNQERITLPPSAQRKTPADLPCSSRGDLIGTVYCGCQGAPDVYRCEHPAVEIHICTMHAIAVSRKELERPDGSREPFLGGPGFCNICRHRG